MRITDQATGPPATAAAAREGGMAGLPANELNVCNAFCSASKKLLEFSTNLISVQIEKRSNKPTPITRE